MLGFSEPNRCVEATTISETWPENWPSACAESSVSQLPSSFETTFYLYNKYLVEATPRLTLVATPWSCIEGVCRSGPSPIRKGHAVRHTPGHLTASSAIAHHDQVVSGTVGRNDRCGGGYRVNAFMKACSRSQPANAIRPHRVPACRFEWSKAAQPAIHHKPTLAEPSSSLHDYDCMRTVLIYFMVTTCQGNRTRPRTGVQIQHCE